MNRHHSGSADSSVEADAAPSDAGSAEDSGPAPSRRDWGALALLTCALALIVLDGTIVGVALPTIIHDLGLDLTDAQWVNSLYAVLLAAALLSTGTLADRIGRKRLVLAGIAVFMVGSILAAMSTSAGPLLAARAVQAIGASFIMPSTLSTVNTMFRGKYRAAAVGIWGAVISGAAAIGPLAGGALTQWASWHWIFLVNIPIGIVLFVFIVKIVPETRGEIRTPGFDTLGALLSAIGFGALVFAVIEGTDLGWWKPVAEFRIFGLHWSATAAVSPVPVAGAIALVSLVAFILWELRRVRAGQSVLLDLRLFRLGTFSWGNLTALTVAVGEFGLLFVLPLYLINVLGMEIIGAGLVLTAMALGAFASGGSARHLAARFGSPGTVLIGLALEMSGVLILALLIRADTPGWLVALPLVLYGLGLGLASAQLTGVVLQDIPLEESGQGSAAQSTARQIGSALGTAFSGAALSIALVKSLPPHLENAGLPDGVADQLADATRESAGTTISLIRDNAGPPLGDHTAAAMEALTQGFADGARWSLLASTVFLALGFLGAARLRQAAKASTAN